MVSILVDIIIIVHFLWILFLIFGFVFALKGSRVAYVHLGGLVFALVLNAMGWYCPLTHMENYFRSLHDVRSVYSTSFIARSLERFIYPDIPEKVLRGGEIVLTAIYIVVYGYWAIKMGWWRRVNRRMSNNE